MVKRREVWSSGPSCPDPSPALLEPDAFLPAHSISQSLVFPHRSVWLLVISSAWGTRVGFSWSGCVLPKLVATHPSCTCLLPLSTRSESWGVDYKSEITLLPFLPSLSSFVCFSFLLHAAQRMQKAAKIKKKAVCRTKGFACVSGPRPVQFGGRSYL